MYDSPAEPHFAAGQEESEGHSRGLYSVSRCARTKISSGIPRASSWPVEIVLSSIKGMIKGVGGEMMLDTRYGIINCILENVSVSDDRVAIDDTPEMADPISTK